MLTTSCLLTRHLDLGQRSTPFRSSFTLETNHLFIFSFTLTLSVGGPLHLEQLRYDFGRGRIGKRQSVEFTLYNQGDIPAAARFDARVCTSGVRARATN